MGKVEGIGERDQSSIGNKRGKKLSRGNKRGKSQVEGIREGKVK